ncbi:chorismate synthase [Romboutsia sp. 1001216sp1]|uniref:chorismate synthase n=1 Tax=unclassified Romboutsia TaxID=2626894 RepID=UPI0018AC2EC2|nr:MULTISPECIES: chorismate synthase [unclassified Romboutsia]MDB8792783.1 chorismate synthase [Romboutsia sp. 1001216sp1]MDB8795415.1 chorismate synthase [Romboutsia sp. 1001216sp1]MDB8799225.1 chorismate synthase [Romboutsia sp. 1001216sp1]
MLRYLTSGESHGQSLISILDGVPANIELDFEEINKELKKRQGGYGRGGRMQIERDKINILGGVRGKKTLGGPISIEIKNKDYENWTKYMNPMEEVDLETRKVSNVRPGHADLVGCLKYDFKDARNVLERSSARETASRVAVGAICKQILKNFNVEFTSHVVNIGGVEDKNLYEFDYIKENVDTSQIRCVNKNLEEKIIERIDKAKSEGDTLGGVVEIRVKNIIPGLGSYTQFDKKIDGQLAMHLMAIQAIKGVEIGIGFDVSSLAGSCVMDEISYDKNEGIKRATNRLGGIEGGMTTGEEIIIRCAMKPIPTLYKPLNSININTLESYSASIERSDNCAVPACSVVCENVVAFVICNHFLEKIGGDNLNDLKSNYNSYIKRLGERGWKR